MFVKSAVNIWPIVFCMLMGIKGRDYIWTVFTGSDFGLFTYFLITHLTGETVKAHEGLNLSF